MRDRGRRSDDAQVWADALTHKDTQAGIISGPYRSLVLLKEKFMDHVYVLREHLNSGEPGDEKTIYFQSKKSAHDYLVKEGYKVEDKEQEIFRTIKNFKSALDEEYFYTKRYTAFLSKEKVLP